MRHLYKFKDGDEVTIRTWESLCQEYSFGSYSRGLNTPFPFTLNMKEFCGQKARIRRITYSEKGEKYYLSFMNDPGERGYIFCKEMFKESTSDLRDKLMNGKFDAELI